MCHNNFATFTSWKFGSHNITLCDTIDQVIGVMDCTHDGYDEDEIPDMSNFDNQEAVRTKLDELTMSENIWVEWEDGTWMTIQRITPTEKEMEEITDHVIERARKAKVT